MTDHSQSPAPEAEPPRSIELLGELEHAKKFLRQCARFSRSIDEDLPFDLEEIVAALKAARSVAEVEAIMLPVVESMNAQIMETLPD